jgi:hypothetical protein
MGPLSQAGLGPRPIRRRTALSYSRDVDSLRIISQRNEKKKYKNKMESQFRYNLWHISISKEGLVLQLITKGN